MEGKKRARRIALAVLVVLALAAGVFALYRNGWFERIDSVEELRALIDRAGAFAGIVFFLLQMLTVIIAWL